MKNLDDLNRHGGLILAVAFVLFQLFDVTTYPLFNIDEPVINDASWQLVTTGQFRADILSLYPGFKDRWLAYPPAQSAAAAICYEFFGIGLWQTRLPSILFGGLGVWSVFAFVRSINPGTIGAWVAALALFFWPDWVLTAKESRMDTGAILALVLATHLSLRALSSPAPPNLHTFLVAGLSASLATVFHTAALLWAFCLVLVVFAFAKKRIRSTLAFLVGVSAFGLAWLAYALQSPADFQTQYLSLLVNRSGGGGPLDRLTSEASRYFREFYRLPTFYLVGLVAAYGLVSQRCWTDPKTRALLTLTVLTIAVHGFVAGKGSGFYTLYPMTLVFCLVGSGIEALVATRSLTAGTSAPWIAALSVFFWPEWVLTAKESRMDTAAILGMVLSTHLVIRALCSTGPHVLRTLFLAGLCASAATIFHSTALLWTFSLAVIVFLFARDRLTSSLVYGIGAAVFGLAWIAYALQYPAEFQAQYLALLINRTGGGGVLLRLVSEGERYVREFARLPTIYLVVLVAAGGLIVERCWSDRRIRILLVLTALVFLTHGVLAGKVSGFYTLYPMTLAFCVVGIGIDAALTEDRPAPGRRWFAAGAMVVVAAFLLNLSAFSVGPRILAFLYQGPERDYARQLEGLTRHLAPGDQVWGSAVTWLAVTKAGARLDALDWVPREKEPEPDPMKHKFVVVFRGDDFAGMEAYRKIDEVGTETPRIFGATLTNRPYTFDLWRSRSLP